MLKRRIETPDDVNSVCFSPCGKCIAIGSGGGILIADSESGKIKHKIRDNANFTISSVMFGNSSSVVISGSWDATVKIWDLASDPYAMRTLSGHSDGVYAVAVSPNGKRVASASADKTVRIWCAASGECCAVLRGHTGSVLCVAWSRDSRMIASGAACMDNSVRMWDAVSGELVTDPLKEHERGVWAVALNKDATLLVSGSGDGLVKVWGLAGTPTVLRTFTRHKDCVKSVAFHVDGRHVVTASYDKTVRVWDVHTGREDWVLKGHSGYVTSAALSADGGKIASGSFDKSVCLWDTKMQVCVPEIMWGDGDLCMCMCMCVCVFLWPSALSRHVWILL
jgi:WD40 repeat protein